MSESPEQIKEATKSFKFNHTMIRIKDPKVSLKFYQEVLGMELVQTMENSDFTLYFLCWDHSNGKESAQYKLEQRGYREGVLELTHNHGTETDDSFVGYHNGNKEPRGYGHIGVSVDNIEEACERFEKLGAKFQKRLSDGRMKNIAFMLDPDGYWIEIFPAKFT